MLHNLLAKELPVVPVGARSNVPEIKLEFSFGKGGAGERLVMSLDHSDLHGGLHGGMVDRLEDHLVHLKGLVALEG